MSDTNTYKTVTFDQDELAEIETALMLRISCIDTAFYQLPEGGADREKRIQHLHKSRDAACRALKWVRK